MTHRPIKDRRQVLIQRGHGFFAQVQMIADESAVTEVALPRFPL